MLLNRIKDYAVQLKSKFNFMELSGALGDLGTLLPILISLSKTGQISLSSSLFFGGLWNILTGLSFQIPMCVQPMKAIAASALSNNLSIEQVMSAGIFVSTIVAFLGITRTLSYINKYIPLPIIRGIQLGAGLQLSIKACDLTNKLSFYNNISPFDNYYYCILGFLLVFIFYFNTRVPSAIILFVLGLILTISFMVVNKVKGPYFELYHPNIIVPTPNQFSEGILKAGLGQLPLTLLNSVIALAALADDLFPSKAPYSINKIAISVGLMNIIGCFFGSMPYCHGSGGLAGQYRFGARSEISIIILGIIKLVLGLFLGNSLITSISSFPNSILSILLFICGVELSFAAKKFTVNEEQHKKDIDFIIVLVTAALQLGFKSDAIGFLGGMVVAYTFILMDFIHAKCFTHTPVHTNNENTLEEDPFYIK